MNSVDGMHQVEIHVFTFVGIFEQDQETFNRFHALMKAIGREVLQARIRKSNSEATRLFLMVSRPRDTEFSLEVVQEPGRPMVVAAYIKSGRLAYLCDVPYSLAEMLAESPILTLSEAKRKLPA